MKQNAINEGFPDFWIMHFYWDSAPFCLLGNVFTGIIRHFRIHWHVLVKFWTNADDFMFRHRMAGSFGSDYSFFSFYISDLITMIITRNLRLKFLTDWDIAGHIDSPIQTLIRKSIPQRNNISGDNIYIYKNSTRWSPVPSSGKNRSRWSCGMLQKQRALRGCAGLSRFSTLQHSELPPLLVPVSSALSERRESHVVSPSTGWAFGGKPRHAAGRWRAGPRGLVAPCPRKSSN